MTGTNQDRFAPLGQLMRERYSCRAFLERPLAQDQIRLLLDTAQHTASWCNAQPWEIHIVSGGPLAALKLAMVERAESGAKARPDLDWPQSYQGVYQARRRECGWALYRSVGIQAGDRTASLQQSNENFRLFGAPHLAVISSPAALGTHGVMDCGAWVSSFMLAATAMGVATIAQAAVASWPDILRQHLNISGDRHIVCGISFGHEDATHPANQFRTTRAPLNEVAHWIG